MTNQQCPFWNSLRCFAFGLPVAFTVIAKASNPEAHVCTPEDPHAGMVAQSPDFQESTGLVKGFQTSALSGPIAPASGQPTGALSGRIVFTSGGHGWAAGVSSWALGRPVLLEMNEDYGNVDQMNLFATYCFNAGAVVVPMRPIGNQTNEVVLDNDDAAVTYVGGWSDSASTIYYGSPGDVPYRFASLGATETATVSYTPNLPAAGFYPVYTWVRHGSDRTSQLYRIRHTGGESLVRIPHHMVGNGWVYLGTYYFNAGSNSSNGAVVISNLQPTPTVGSVVIADAIRFGNGMGSVDRGFGVSSYPREDECSRYWVQASLGQGQSATLYDPDLPTITDDDQNDNVGAPIRMASEMNRETEGNIYKRIYISFHSNAGGSRGVVGLWNDNANFPGTGTPNQFRLAQLTGTEVNNDLVGIGVPPLETAWFNRGSSITATQTFAFGEIRNDTLGGEMDATIIEVAFHDDASDALLLRDPKARNWIARASYQAVLRYMNEFDAAPLTFLPEPPANVRVAASGSNMVLNWSAPVAQGGSGAATGYVVYQSTNGYGFGNPVAVGSTSFTFTNVAAGLDLFFRVAATNSGGESFPSETVACRRSTNVAATKVLLVNAFDRFDRNLNPRQTPTAQSFKPPGHNANTGTMDRVLPRVNNAFDYLVAHAQAVGAFGLPYDSCQNEAVSGGSVTLGSYPIVVWACGQESTTDETFSSLEQTAVTTFANNGGALFVSGSDIAWDLDRASGPTAGDRTFLNNILHADLVSDANDNSGSYAAAAVAGAVFTGKPTITFDSGTNGIYGVRTPEILTPVGTGATKAMNYGGGSSGAAIQYDGSAGGGRVVYFGFPFETIISASLRTQYMAGALTFLISGVASNVPPSISLQPQGQFVVQGSDATLTVSAAGSLPLSYQWRFNGATMAGATASSYLISNAQPTNSGNYSVVVSNAYGMATSQVALVEVILSPVQTLFSDNFDLNTVASWTTNRSSADTRITFNWDYSLIGIASAPNSTGSTTRGLRFEANLSNGVTAAVSVSPIGQNFGGNYRLHFDMWINANGPFPLGGTGSTEHLTAGVGTTGNNVQWNTDSADGVWFAADGEGQATDTSASLPDWHAYVGTTLQAGSSGVYVGGTESNIRGNGHPYYASTFHGGQTAPTFQQANFPQQTGALAVGTVGLAWRDVIVNKTGNTVEWFIDGLKIATISSASFAASNIFVGYWDSFNSLSDNTNLSFGLVDNVRVERFVTNVPPYLTVQPQGTTVPVGSNATFNVTAGGTASLAYQWRLNGTNIAGATSSSYTRNSAQAIHTGNYSVVITNAYGSVTSSNALLTLAASQPLQFTLISRLADGGIRLGVSGEPGFTFQIATSTNLINWNVLTNLPNPSGSLQFTDAPASGVNLFYRAQYP
ncbi:MAG: hypothetical protein HOP33_05450 [Verrucomicrobia bacterium]|nr:hypothetical protein [Verrucomicrobiota bacterium]